MNLTQLVNDAFDGGPVRQPAASHAAKLAAIMVGHDLEQGQCIAALVAQCADSEDPQHAIKHACAVFADALEQAGQNKATVAVRKSELKKVLTLAVADDAFAAQVEGKGLQRLAKEAREWGKAVADVEIDAAMESFDNQEAAECSKDAAIERLREAIAQVADGYCTKLADQMLADLLIITK